MMHRPGKVTTVLLCLFQHPRWPLVLAFLAIIFMLPTLGTGLLGDDLIQRVTQFRAEELPARVLDTGFVPREPGKLGTVLCNLFGYLRGEEAASRARDYGIAPWWANAAWQAALFRPLTALTHWLDYRWFPNTPSLMHAHSIVWYALAVLLVAIVYRTVGACYGRSDQPAADPGWGTTSICAAGLAALFWLLDKDNYFPVMYVANRGFIISLVFGVLCLQAHIRWRRDKGARWMLLSALCLSLSLLANEGGASSLAFLIAFALALESGGWRRRLGGLLPAALVLLVWRAVYVGAGFGVKNVLLYIDPGYEPFLFLKNFASRANALLGGQLAGLPPEISLGFNPTWQMLLAAAFAVFSLLCAIVFLAVLRSDPVARYWAVVMLLAIVPAATVAPLSKNLAFVAIGAFGLIASFLTWFAARQTRVAMRRPFRSISWTVAFLLILTHVGGALAGRALMAMVSPSIPKIAERACSFPHAPEIGERTLVVVNDPTLLTGMIPFQRTYRQQPLPRMLRVLVPGSTRLRVTRASEDTLVVSSGETDLFDCPALGRFGFCYCCKGANDFLFGERTWKAGDRVRQKGLLVEVLEVSARGAPRSVAFHFEQSLDSKEMVWLFFDWPRFAHYPFALPRPGETIEIAGADRWHN